MNVNPFLIKPRAALGWLGGVLLALTVSSASAGEKVAVFYSSTLPVNKRQEVIKSEGKLDDVTVFARSKDFLETVKSSDVSMVIAPASFSDPNYEVVGQFALSGSSDFVYVVISTKDIDPAKISTSNIGLVEEVGRVETTNYVKDKAKIPVSKVKGVSKPEDLFPLLVFNAADAVLMPKTQYEDLKKVFTAKTQTVNVPSTPTPLPQVFLKKGADKALAEKILTLKPEALKALGFDEVRRAK